MWVVGPRKRQAKKSAPTTRIRMFLAANYTLPRFVYVDFSFSSTGARAEARAAIPWFEAWEEDTTESLTLNDEEEALVNVAAVMGFNYAYEGFPTC